jgi:hypothetical protein
MGKTTSAIQYAINQARQGNKVVLVQPSTNLIDQTYRDLQSYHAPGILSLMKGCFQVNKFHTEYTPGPVKEAVMDHLNNAPAITGEIMLITHQTFLTLPYWHNANFWEVIVDEIPQIHTEWVLKLPVNHKTITDHIVLGETYCGYAPISIKPGSEAVVARIAENQFGDDQDKLFQELASNLMMNDRWSTVIALDGYTKTMSGLSKTTNNLHTHSLLRPEQFEKFKSFTVMGAMFTESVMYKIWSKTVDFTEHTAIASGLKSRAHSNGSLLKVRYLFETNWSKGLRDSAVNNRKIYGVVKDKVLEEMGDAMFIYAANNDDVKGLNAGIRLSTKSHGINSYKGIHNAAFLSALNANGPSFAFMKSNNISSTEMTEAQYLQSLYQFVMRTSLRDEADTNVKTILVMDKRGADYLARHFPGCTVEQVEGVDAPVAKKSGRTSSGDAKTASERMKEYRSRMKVAATIQ